MRGNRSSFTAIVAGALILAGKATMAQTAADEDLVHLAKKHFRYESIPDEEKKAFDIFFLNIQAGTAVDVAPKRDPATDDRDWKILTDPVYAELWEKERVVKADWLVWICTYPKASEEVTSTGVEIVGARIDGQVALAYAKTQFPLRASRCAFKEDIVLDRSILRSLQLQGTQIIGLQGDGLTVEGDILLSDGFRAVGLVSLQEAAIGGRLDCGNGQFINPGAIALSLEGAKTSAAYLRNGFRAKGGVLLREATVGGDLDCSIGHFINPWGPAINAGLTNILGSVRLIDGFEADGSVSFQEARIDHEFILRDAIWHENASLNLIATKAKNTPEQCGRLAES